MKFKSLSLILAMCLFFPSLVMAQDGPKMELETSRANIDKIKAGTTISYDFKVKNVGNQDLLITEVVPGCGCSIAKFDKVIEPGKTGVVSISVEIYPQWAGQKLSKSSTMVTNDPVATYTNLVITGQILPDETASKPPLKK